MILITGATGNIGRATVEILHGRGHPVRAMSRTPATAGLPDGVDVVEGSPHDPAPMAAALDGVDAVLVILHGDPHTVVQALGAADVRRVVLVSSICVATRTDLAYANELRATEQRIREVAPHATVLRPGQFMSNTLWWRGMLPDGVLALPFADVDNVAIAPEDIAAVAATALTDDGHAGQTHALSGPAPVSARQQVAILGETLGRALEVRALSDEEFRRHAPGDRAMQDYLIALNGAPNATEREVRDTVRTVAGRDPMTYRAWVERHVDEFG